MDKIKNFWFNLDDKIRYLCVGCFNAGVCFLIYSLLILILGTSHHQLSLALAWFLSSFCSFFTQKIFVFETRGNYVKEYFSCLGTWFCSYLINAFLLEILVKYLISNVFISQLIANFTAAVFTYILFKFLVFKKSGI